jgi:transposase
LGRHFAIDPNDWPTLCARIEQLLSAQSGLMIECTTAVERMAQHCYEQLLVRTEQSTVGAGEHVATAESSAPRYESVDIDSLENLHPRSVGVEHVALQALNQVGFIDHLQSLGINGVLRSAILGSIIGRMAQPGSERATLEWLQTRSALGELLDVDYTSISHMSLYRASDALMKHRESIQAHLFNQVQNIFGFEQTITLFDLTNTYVEGMAKENPKAKHGRSKEKRSDCRLITLGLVLDGSGFVKYSQTFEGNVSEPGTMAGMLKGLGALPGAMVIVDAGIATEENLQWLSEQGYRYLAVKRSHGREMNLNDAITIENASGASIRLDKQLNEDKTEVLLYCHSSDREAKENGMTQRVATQFEGGLQAIKDGLLKPRFQKRYDKLLERIGRLKEKSHGASQHYEIHLTKATVKKGKHEWDVVTEISWEKKPVQGTMASNPGVYCLRTNELQWDAEHLWRTYIRLTDIESVFRSLKSELGLRPIYHQTEYRTDGHLFITVLAYQCVQIIRTTLRQAGINNSWSHLRHLLNAQQRLSTRMKRADGYQQF